MEAKEKKLFDLNSFSLIACETIQVIIKIFIDLFFVSKIYACSASVSTKILYIALFYIIQFILTGIPFLFSGHLLVRINKSIYVSIGAILLTATVLLVYIFGLGGEGNLLSYTPLIGVIYGLGYTFFSAGHGALQGEVVNSEKLIKFSALKKIIGQVVTVLFPVSFGLIVDNLSFSYLSIIIIALCVIMIVFSFLIKPKQQFDTDFSFKKYREFVKEHKEAKKPLILAYICDFFRGASYDSIVVLMVLFTIRAYGSNTALGLLTSVFTLCSIVLLLFYLKFYRKRRATFFVVPVIVLVSVSAIILCITTTQVTVAIFYAAFTILNVVLISISDARRRGGIARALSMYGQILEVNAVCEVSLMLGRIMTLSIILLCGILNSEILLYVALGFASLMYVCFGTSIIFLEKTLDDEGILILKNNLKKNRQENEV